MPAQHFCYALSSEKEFLKDRCGIGLFTDSFTQRIHEFPPQILVAQRLFPRYGGVKVPYFKLCFLIEP